MEALDMDNILSPEEIDDLFSQEVQDTEDIPSEDGDNKTNKEATEVEQVDPDSLFEEPESVGSGKKEDTQVEEDTNSEKETGASPKTNLFSSIASALKEEGILSGLNDDDLNGIKTSEDFAEALEKHIQAQLDERQRRIDEALQVGVEPDEVRKYESTINYLQGITEDVIADETSKGETLRKQLIFQDFLNRGYSKERATREVKKSFDSGSDIEDAKEALASNLEYFQREYQQIIEERREEEEQEKAELKEQSAKLKKSILEDKQIFEGVDLDKSTRQKIYDSISKPIYKDPDTGEYLTAVQKYERENRVDFLKKLGLLFTLTDGFEKLDKLIKPTAKKQVRKSLRELEHTINTTSRNIDGSLNLITGVSDDPESRAGWEIDA